MKGVRALASGMLVLALSCAIPAISLAQDSGTTTDASTTTTATPPAVPADPATPPTDPSDASGNQREPKPPKAPPAEPAPGTPTEPAPSSSAAADPSLAGDGSPGDGSGGGARKSSSTSVTMGDLFFSPASVSIAVGDTVTWNNTGQAPHNATADDGSFKTPTIENGESASHTFTQAGTFSYVCTIHPNMKGTIRVISSGGGGGGGGGGASSSGSSGSSSSESAAVASPGAAGDANTLPMTGMAVGGLALVGFALLGLGLIARQADRERSRLRWFSIF
jgi:plastocyanin